MLEQLFQSFAQSNQGQQAYRQLQSQGYAPQQAAGMLQAAFPAAVQSLQGAIGAGGGNAAARPAGPGLTDIGQSNYATNFLTAAVSGLIRGQGFMGSAIDGVQGVVGGHVAQVMASRFGLPQRVAGMAGAVVTPLMIDFLWDKVGGLNLGALTGGGAGAQGGGGFAPAGGGFGSTAFGAGGGGGGFGSTGRW